MATETLRNADLGDLAALLRDQHGRKVDVVAGAQNIRSIGGVIHIDGTEPELTEDGVGTTTGTFLPTAVADEGIAEKLGIPTAYMRKLRESRPDLYDTNVNGWLHGQTNFVDPNVQSFTPDARKFLVRNFRPQDGGQGICRAFLSDRYRVVDNLDVLTAALEGIEASGANVQIRGCDLSERKMRVRIVCEEVAVLAPVLLEGYRSPFNGPSAVQRVGYGHVPGDGTHTMYKAGQEPVVFAGFELSNSETGGGAFTLVPRLEIAVCSNGLTISLDALRSVHLGGRLDEGIINWSVDTLDKQLALVTAQARDAVATFLDAEYVTRKIAELEQKASTPVTDAAGTVEQVSKALRYSEERRTSVFSHFILGGQMTAAGVLNAITSVAQTLDDSDEAAEMESHAIRAMELVANAR